MAMRGKHRDVIETRRREERRADVRRERLAIAVGIIGLIASLFGSDIRMALGAAAIDAAKHVLDLVQAL